MVYCRDCGTKLEDNEKYCPNCGAEKLICETKSSFNKLTFLLVLLVVFIVLFLAYIYLFVI